MNLKQNIINGNRILSRNMGYSKKQRQKEFQNIDTIFRTNSIDFRCFFFFFFFFFFCPASWICSRSLYISRAIIVVFSTKIFQNLDLGIKWVLRCKAMELEAV